MDHQIKTTAIIGMGALGMLYASQRSGSVLGPDAVYFIADQNRIERYKKMTFTINGIPWSFSDKSSCRRRSCRSHNYSSQIQHSAFSS